MPYLKPEALDGALRSGKIGSLYLFDGPEEWLKERALRQIVEKLVPAEFKDFNLDRWDGNSATPAQIVSSIQSLPFMGERRVVVVQNADELSAADARVVGAALADVPPSTCLVLTCQGKANLRDEIPAKVGSHGAIVTFWTPFPNQLPGWAVAEAKRRGKALTGDAAALVAESCADLRQMADEIDKLCLFVGAKKSIDGADVRAHGLPDAAGDYKDLEEAVWGRDFREALRQGQLLSESGIRAEAIFPVFSRIFKALVVGHFLKAERQADWEAVAAAAGARGRMQQEALARGLRAYSAADARRAYGEIVRADFEVKTGQLPSDVAVTLLILRICGPAARPKTVAAGWQR